MRIPEWLEELHRQWVKARGSSLKPRSKPFTRDWEDLLESSGLRGAEDLAAAAREAGKLETEGKLALKRQPGRHHRILRIILPVESESWLRQRFATESPETIRDESISIVRKMAERSHRIYPDLWKNWMERVETAFQGGKNIHPVSWRYPMRLAKLLEMTFRVSSNDWNEGTLIREASAGSDLSTKTLEKSSRGVEACLSAMFGQPITLAMLGITSDQIRLELAGNLTLHFADGRSQTINALGGSYQLTTDLERATHATTRAKRILTVENQKTTFRRLASNNENGETLLVASSFPGKGLARLIQLLPDDLPIFHFGDTDPAGYLIFSKIRDATERKVTPFLMHYRQGQESVPFTEYDLKILPKLSEDPNLEGLKKEVRRMMEEGSKGLFEQESLGTPDLTNWPFYSIYQDK